MVPQGDYLQRGGSKNTKKSACGIVPQGDYPHALAHVFLAQFVQGEQPAHSGVLPLLGGTGTRGQKSACEEPPHAGVDNRPLAESLVGVPGRFRVGAPPRQGESAHRATLASPSIQIRGA